MRIADQLRHRIRLAIAALGLVSLAPWARAQAPTPIELRQLVQGLTVTPRVLLISLRPGGENLPLIAWLSRGRHVQTAVLSLTRGESSINFAGMEMGLVLGAVHVQEALAARRIDGADQFFTRMYDVGDARDTADVFKHWNRDSLVGDIVTVIRSFRPHVIVAEYAPGTAKLDPELQALAAVVRDAFDASPDFGRFPFSRFGPGWRPSKLYAYGPGLRIPVNEFDRAFGRTYASLAIDARVQFRTSGLANVTLPLRTPIDLQRVAPIVNDSAPAEQSIFDGVDTSFARLRAYAPAAVVDAIPLMMAYADSARRAFDVNDPGAVVSPLAHIAQLATSARGELAWCRHPAMSAMMLVVPGRACSLNTLDLDASIDLVRQRATTALLAAAGVTMDATSDRELVADGDTGVVMVTIANHGTTAVTLRDVTVWGSAARDSGAITIAPDSSAHVFRTVTHLASPHPWWIQNRTGARFPEVPSAADGIDRAMLIPSGLTVPSVAVPENIRRASDATVTLSVAGATVSTSLGPVVFEYADAVVGLQRRPIAGLPDVSLRFERGLQWIPEHATVSRWLRLFATSYSDHERSFTPRPFAPRTVTVDSAPKSITLAPHESRDLVIKMRARMDSSARQSFGLAGAYDVRAAYTTGVRTSQYSYLAPVRLEGSSGFWLQPVEISVPPGMVVGYVGLNDDVVSALQDVGVAVAIIKPEDLLYADLSKVNTLLFSARVFEIHPELLAQSARVLDFARAGGTVVVMRGEYTTLQSRMLPFAATASRPVAVQVTQPDAPVVATAPKSRLLQWPNAIRQSDWDNWVSGRASSLPSNADPRYARVVAMHDPDQPENDNAILVARLGKGAFVYAALTLDQQIEGGVPGALRLLVNMLSAGQTPRASAAAR